MKAHMVVGASLVVMLAGSVYADDALKSGPQAGQNIPGAFNPLHANGPDAGKKVCLV